MGKGAGPPSTVSSAGAQMNGKPGSLSQAHRATTKQKSVKHVLGLLRSLFRGSALRQLGPVAALAMAKTALKHVSARTQGALMASVFMADSAAFYTLLQRNLLICTGTAAAESTKTFAEAAYALRWRRALTDRLHGAYFSGTVFYRLAQLDRRVENPGDRVAGDVPLFTEELARVVVESCLASTDAAFFLRQMHRTGGSMSIVAVLGYVTFGGALVFGLAPNLARLHGKTRELEGRFRELHARLRQWSEAVAFAAARDIEASILGDAFRRLAAQTRRVLWRVAWYRVVFDFFVKYVATTFAIGLILGPFFGGRRSAADSVAAKAATLSAMRYHTDVIIGAFTGVGAVAGACNQLVHLGGYAARIRELEMLAARHAASEASNAAGGDSSPWKTGAAVSFDGLTVETPTGVPLVKNLTLTVPPRTNLLVTGPNGAGKSSLFRVLGGLWKPTAGTVTKPCIASRGGASGLGEEIFYVPQRPYVSVGTLRSQLTYPRAGSPEILSDSAMRDLLRRVDLEHLMKAGEDNGQTEAVDDPVMDWGETLTLGEQQRLGLARLFYRRPRYAILDECTSAVTMAMEARLCDALTNELNTTCITISHRPALVAVHQLNLALDGKGGFEIRSLPNSDLSPHTSLHAAPATWAPQATAKEIHNRAASMRVQEQKNSAPSTDRIANATREKNIDVAVAGQGWKWLLRMLMPGCVGQLCLLFAAIVTRTALSDRIAHLNGQSLRHVIGQDSKAFGLLLGASLLQAAAQAVLAPSMLSIAESIALTWRVRLTDVVSTIYFECDGYYTAGQLDGLKDADQRIAEDIPKLCTTLAALFPGLIKPLVDISWYSVRMWQLTGRRGLAVLYGYMVFGLGVLRVIAPDFGAMEAKASRLEGDFRHAHARLAKHAESVAFCGGGQIEHSATNELFSNVSEHIRGMNRKKWKFGVAEHFITKELPHNVTWALSLLFVLALQGAHFGNLQLQGDLGHDIRFLATTVSHSFIAFGEILDLYKKFATLGGYKVRLDELLRALDAGKMRAQSTDATAKLVSEYGNHDQLVLDKLTVKTPAAAGSTREPIELAREISVTMRPGENMLLTGPNGSGKTSVCRVVCGLWPSAGGRALLPRSHRAGGALIYVPQRPYLVVGTLREQLTYPDQVDSPKVMALAEEHGTCTLDETLEALLDLVGLKALLSREYDGGKAGWDATAKWEDVFSLGEQQRLCMARLFFRRPQFAILDECTNATSVDIEHNLYRIAERLEITVVTISQRPALVGFHPRELHLSNGKGDWILRNASPHS